MSGGGTSSPLRRGLDRESGGVLLGGLILAVAVLAVYANSLRAEFVFDDEGWIVENAAIRRLWPLTPHLLDSPRPALSLSLALSYATGGEDPLHYHLFNVATHLLATLTLFGLLRRTLRRSAFPEEVRGASLSLAAAAALLWAVHPLLTESVTYVVQRCESLMGLFMLLTLYGVVRAAECEEAAAQGGDASGGVAPRLWRAMAVAACAAGMAAKEVMVVAPVVVLVYDALFLSDSWGAPLRRRGLFYAALAATWGILAALRVGADDQGDSAGFGRSAITPAQYALTQPGVILHYLRLSFWPEPLCFDYGWPVAQGVAQIFPAALVVGGLLAATAWGLGRRRPWAFAGGWFFLILAPTSSVMPINDLAAERRMYLPLAAVMAGVVLAAFLLGGALLRRVLPTGPARRRTGAILALLLLLAAAGGLGALTARRNALYRSALSVWEDVLRQRPGNPRAWYNAGVIHGKAGRRAEALYCYSRSIEARPDYEARVYYNRGETLAAMGRLHEAIADYSRAIAMDSRYVRAFVNRGAALTALGRCDDAIPDLDRALQLDLRSPEAWHNRGAALAAKGAHGEAMRDYRRAIELKPGYAAAHYGMGNALFHLDRPAEAVAEYGRALAARPDYAEALQNRAVAWLTLREFGRAWADVRRLREVGVEPTALVQALRAAEGGDGGRRTADD